MGGALEMPNPPKKPMRKWDALPEIFPDGSWPLLRIIPALNLFSAEKQIRAVK